MKVSEVQKRFPEKYEKRGLGIPTYRTPEEESFLDQQKRVWKAFTTVVNEQDNHFPAIISHAGVIRTILCKMLDIELKDMFQLKIEYGGSVLIRHSNQNFSIVAFNYNSPLTPPPILTGV